MENDRNVTRAGAIVDNIAAVGFFTAVLWFAVSIVGSVASAWATILILAVMTVVGGLGWDWAKEHGKPDGARLVLGAAFLAGVSQFATLAVLLALS